MRRARKKEREGGGREESARGGIIRGAGHLRRRGSCDLEFFDCELFFESVNRRMYKPTLECAGRRGVAAGAVKFTCDLVLLIEGRGSGRGSDLLFARVEYTT